jgi:hypothetical protein
MKFRSYRNFCATVGKSTNLVQKNALLQLS